jgi:hypothetical protein
VGLFDDVIVEVPLPDGRDPTGVVFQTKTFPYPFMERYTIRADGRLIARRVEWEVTPEDELPYKGAPDSLMRLVGSMRPAKEWTEDTNYHGDLNFYYLKDTGPDTTEWWYYTARFTNGQLESITVVTDHE